MSTFWKVRVATLLWGFSVSYVFTEDLGFASAMFAVMVIGNTIIMKVLIKEKNDN